MKLELASLRSEREKALAVDAEAARGTAKGRPYEEAVAEAVEAIALAMGDDCDAVGDFRGGGGRKGDVVVDIDGCAGAAARPDRLRGQELAALAQGGAGRAGRGDGPARRRLRRAGSCPPRSCLPARAVALREVGGDKLFVVFDPADGSRLALEVAYSLARARVLMAKGGVEGSTPRRCAPRSSGRWARWTRCAGSSCT